MVNWLKFSLFAVLVTLILGFTLSSTWGFHGHKKINRMAIFCVPKDLFYFYKKHAEYLTEHAVDPDKRRYAVEGEAPRHFIDIDHYNTADSSAFDRMPRHWGKACEKFTEDSLMKYGVVPWNVYKYYFKLRDAFTKRDVSKILKYSADIGHYIADVHVPLHTTENYNGQLTNQKGIHAFWESRLPELFSKDYDFFLGSASYIDNPLDYIWEAVEDSHKALDSVLHMEKKLSEEFGSENKYTFENRASTTTRVYSKEFSKAYHEKLDGMVERRMQTAIRSVAAFWYTAWVDGGQPKIDELMGEVEFIENKVSDTINLPGNSRNEIH